MDVNQATVNRWKTLVVRPGRDKLIELLKNVFALGYDDIDAMLWLAGLPEMTREECRSVMGSTESFRGKTESELQTRASKLISEIISETLGLPGTEDGTAAVEAVQDLTTKTNGKKQSTAIDWRKDEETHRKSSLLIASMSWFAGTIHRFRAWREQRKLKQLLEGKREAKDIYEYIPVLSMRIEQLTVSNKNILDVRKETGKVVDDVKLLISGKGYPVEVEELVRELEVQAYDSTVSDLELLETSERLIKEMGDKLTNLRMRQLRNELHQTGITRNRVKALLKELKEIEKRTPETEEKHNEL
ncbi:MAG: hypothetical protein FJ045_01315 [Crenarchaeota archaeon]|nr:hypothetical protein [Thermoproteota archaeon]